MPEEKERLKKLLPEMAKRGVTNLNLHQLRLTEHNAPKLLKRNYTFIPAEKPIVPESELAALEIMEFAQKQKIDIGINYCSFFFKNRFQPAGFRKQVAKAFNSQNEPITAKGFVKNIGLDGIRYYTWRLYDFNQQNTAMDVLNLEHKQYNFCKKHIGLIP